MASTMREKRHLRSTTWAGVAVQATPTGELLCHVLHTLQPLLRHCTRWSSRQSVSRATTDTAPQRSHSEPTWIRQLMRHVPQTEATSVPEGALRD